MNKEILKSIYQYVLLVAGEEDDYICQSLGPIHLLKYLYLADQYYASRHKGKAYSGVKWKFHKFGPWSNEALEFITPSLNELQAEMRTIESDFNDDDFVRWRLSDSYKLRKVERDLDIGVQSFLKRTVHKYLADTSSLLHYVYLTKPMRNAKPGKYIDFSIYEIEDLEQRESNVDKNALSIRKKKKYDERIAKFRKNLQSKSIHKDVNTRISEPDYDDVYFTGLQWLDGLAGKTIDKEELNVSFSDDIWESDMRKDDELP